MKSTMGMKEGRILEWSPLEHSNLALRKVIENSWSSALSFG